jgi:hypothetical protein
MNAKENIMYFKMNKLFLDKNNNLIFEIDLYI